MEYNPQAKVGPVEQYVDVCGNIRNHRPFVLTHAYTRARWGPHHPETFARSVVRVTMTAFATAMLFVGTALANTGEAPPTIKVTSLQPFAEFTLPEGRATLSVLPTTRWHGPEGVNHARVVVFAMLNDKSAKGYALFTEFRCGDHMFAIPTVMTVTVADGDVSFEQVVQTGPHTQEYTPTDEGKDAWGVLAESYACTGVLPKFRPGTQL